jgi:hypothetical protein
MWVCSEIEIAVLSDKLRRKVKSISMDFSRRPVLIEDFITIADVTMIKRCLLLLFMMSDCFRNLVTEIVVVIYYQSVAFVADP